MKTKIKKLRRMSVRMQGSEATIQFVPNSEGGLRNAYLGIYSKDGAYHGSLDTSDFRRLRMLKKIVDTLLMTPLGSEGKK